MKYFFTAFGLMLIFEGLIYFAIPEHMIRFLKEIETWPPERLKLLGLFSILTGLFICFLATKSQILG